jgi:hypothetical protein
MAVDEQEDGYGSDDSRASTVSFSPSRASTMSFDEDRDGSIDESMEVFGRSLTEEGTLPLWLADEEAEEEGGGAAAPPGTEVESKKIPFISFVEGEYPSLTGDHGSISRDKLKLNRGANIPYFQAYIYTKKDDLDFINSVAKYIEGGISKLKPIMTEGIAFPPFGPGERGKLIETLKKYTEHEEYNNLWKFIQDVSTQFDGTEFMGNLGLGDILFDSLDLTGGGVTSKQNLSEAFGKASPFLAAAAKPKRKKSKRNKSKKSKKKKSKRKKSKRNKSKRKGKSFKRFSLK